MLIHLPIEWNKLNCSTHSVYGHLYLPECVCACEFYVLCVRGLPLQGAELIEILTSGACSETTDITSLCATASHRVQRQTPEGSQLVKPILAHYLNQASIFGGIFTQTV